MTKLAIKLDAIGIYFFESAMFGSFSIMATTKAAEQILL